MKSTMRFRPLLLLLFATRLSGASTCATLEGLVAQLGTEEPKPVDPQQVSYREIKDAKGQVIGYTSKILTHSESEAREIQELAQEALIHFGVPREAVKLSKNNGEFQLVVGLESIPDPNRRRHLAYEASHFNLRKFFGRLELAGYRVEQMLFQLEPAQAEKLVQALSREELLVLAQWDRNHPDEKVSIKDLLECK